MGEHRPRDIEAYAGQRIPLSPPIGAVFVAWRDPEAWLAKASDRMAMESVLNEVRSRGWAASFEPEHYRRSLDVHRGVKLRRVGRVPTFPIQTEVTLLTDVGVGQKALGASSVPLVIRRASLRP
jgi:hypothetical protein